MNDLYKTIDKLYSDLGIYNNNGIARNRINTGTMGRKLNTDCSTIVNNKEITSWSNSVKK